MSDDTTLANGGAHEASLAESRNTAVVPWGPEPPSASVDASKRAFRRNRGLCRARKRRRRAQSAQSPSPAVDARRASRMSSRESGSDSASDACGTPAADTSEEVTSAYARVSSTAAVDGGEAHGAAELAQTVQAPQDATGSVASDVKQEGPTEPQRSTSANGTPPQQQKDGRPSPSLERLGETTPWDRWSQPTPDGGAEPQAAGTSAIAASTPQSGNDNATDAHRDRRKSFVRFGGTTIREITQRTRSALAWHGGQQHMLMALVAVVMLLLSLAVLILIFVRVEEPLVLTRCSSSNCRNAARNLERFVDVGVDPCKDFYGHVCRRWERDAAAAPKDDANAAVVMASDDFLDAHWRFMLARINTSLHVSAAEADAHQGGHAATDLTPLHAVASFYRFCHRFLLSPNVSLAAMLESLKIDIAPLQVVLTAQDPTSQLRAAVTLSLTLGVHIAFSLDVVHSAYHETTQLRVFKGSTLAQKLGEANHTAATEHYLAQLYYEASRLLTSRENAGGSPRLKDVLELDRQLASLLSKGGSEVRFPMTVLGSLSDRLGTLEWIRLVNEQLSPPHRLGYQDYVSVDSYDALRDAIRFFFGKFEGLHEVAYYICLHVLVEVLRLDYQRRQQQQGLAASKSAAESVVRTCVQVTQATLSGTWSVLLSAVLAPESSGEHAARLVVDAVLRSAHHDEMAWMDDALRKRARKIMATVSATPYRPPAGTLSSEHATTVMARLRDAANASQFPGMLWSLRLARRAESLQHPPSESEVAAISHFLGARVRYDARLNVLLLPIAVLLRPVMYPVDVPIEMAMGTLGSLLAEELYRALFPPPNDKELWATGTRHAIDRFEQCLRSLWLNRTNETLAPTPTEADGRDAPGTYGAGELLFWTQGARLAFASLKEALSGFQRATNWPSYWRRAQKGFFRRFCQLRCSASKPSSRLRCLLPLANMVEFPEAFECPGSKAAASKGATGSYCELQ
ncbi:endothelin-converting enzyme 2-like [Dermacentor albipictus]|uniref:endothelin-converting enzyme 2-like n=1 Tax=Dermacentor albipictus TaxID=60249 RepID=UPI0038FD14B6